MEEKNKRELYSLQHDRLASLVLVVESHTTSFHLFCRQQNLILLMSKKAKHVWSNYTLRQKCELFEENQIV